jgi:hypothetical protein
MKTAIFITSVILFGFASFGQTRLNDWPVEKFSSVNIETQLSYLGSTNFSSKDPNIIKMVYDYLNRIELKTFNPSAEVASLNKDDWHFIIKFQDWQDEFRIYEGFALVGKSSYSISKDVSDKFSGFYNRLVAGK